MTHTPGPWYAEDRCIFHRQNTSDKYICEEVRGKNDALIAAAPELLQSLKDLEVILSCLSIDNDSHEMLRTARQVIAKAEGRES
jgi:hypothetical protein